MIHDLKIDPTHFEDVVTCKKMFEVRKNDRDFIVGDMLRLREYDRTKQEYTGRTTDRFITYILCNSLYCKEGMSILSIRP